MLSGLIKPAPCLIEMLDRMTDMNTHQKARFAAYIAQAQMTADMGGNYKCVGHDIGVAIRYWMRFYG